MDLRAALPDDDVARSHDLAAVALHAQELRIRIAPVPARAYALLMCHACLLADPDLADPDFRELLPVALLAAVVLAALPLEDDDLLVLAVPHDLAVTDAPATVGAPTCVPSSVAATSTSSNVTVSPIIRVQRGDADRHAGLGPELLVATANDCVHLPAKSGDRLRKLMDR
jgi:hypothetical protein